MGESTGGSSEGSGTRRVRGISGVNGVSLIRGISYLG